MNDKTKTISWTVKEEIGIGFINPRVILDMRNNTPEFKLLILLAQKRYPEVTNWYGDPHFIESSPKIKLHYYKCFLCDKSISIQEALSHAEEHIKDSGISSFM